MRNAPLGLNNTILYEHPFNEVFNKVFNNDDLELFLLTHGNTLCAGSVLLHKSIFEKYGNFDNRFLQLQDYEMWLRMISNEKLIYYSIVGVSKGLVLQRLKMILFV